MCDGTGDPCDDVCGGGGCGRCGGPSCDNGAVTKADNALDFAMKAEEILKAKEGRAKGVNMNVSYEQIPLNQCSTMVKCFVLKFYVA